MNDIGKSIKKVNNLFKRGMIDNESFPPHTHRARGWVIGYLTKNQDKDIFQKDIEAELCIRRSTATTVLQTMERDGLITRQAVDGDKRLKKIVMTQKATDLHNMFAARAKEINEAMTEGISGEELQICSDVLDRITENLEKIFSSRRAINDKNTCQKH